MKQRFSAGFRRAPAHARLGRTARLTQSGVTRLADRLIGRGWVMREQPPGNRRVMHARLTDEGMKALATTHKAYFSALRAILTERLTDPQIAGLTELTAGVPQRARQAPTQGPGRRALRAPAHHQH